MQRIVLDRCCMVVGAAVNGSSAFDRCDGFDGAERRVLKMLL